MNVEMLKVNIDDISQFLSYHEVFGKLQNEMLPGGESSASVISSNQSAVMSGIPETTVNMENLDDPLRNDNICSVCGKIFQFRYQLIVHKHYHNEQLPFLCQVCGQNFKNYEELTVHGKQHIGCPMAICKICLHVFANDAALERHLKRHSSDKPWRCEICQKTFARKENLISHERSHTRDTPFKCSYCLKCFSRKEHMVQDFGLFFSKKIY